MLSEFVPIEVILEIRWSKPTPIDHGSSYRAVTFSRIRCRPNYLSTSRTTVTAIRQERTRSSQTAQRQASLAERGDPARPRLRGTPIRRPRAKPKKSVDMCGCLHVSAGCVMASRTGKILRAKIIPARARCTRLQDMCNARAYPQSQPIGLSRTPDEGWPVARQ
jgi:hypothetical protein